MPASATDSLFLLENRRYPALDGLRALATLMIFNVHFFAQYSAEDYFVAKDGLIYNLLRTLHSGSLGVDVLFILSGCLTYISLVRHGRVTIPGFLAQRFRRLLPVILAVNLPALCWGVDAVNWRQLADNVFFLKIFPETTLISYITWALVYEMWFYIFFCAAFILPFRWPLFRGWAWFWTVCAVLVLDIVWWNKLSPYNDPRFLDFMAGILLARLMLQGGAAAGFMDRLARPAWLPSLVGIVFMCWLWSLTGVQQSLSASISARLGFQLLYDGAVCLLFWRLLLPGGVTGAFSQRLVRIVGVVSYSLFMTHAQWGLPIALKLAGTAASFPGLLAAWAASAAVSVLLAVLLFSFLERPYFAKS